MKTTTRTQNFFFLALLAVCLALPLLAAAPANPPVKPATDWLTPDGWQMDAAFEPLGATTKRLRYTLNPTNHYIIGFVKLINNKPVRAYTEPILGSEIAPPFNGTIELTEMVSVTNRDFEYWFYPGDAAQ